MTCDFDKWVEEEKKFERDKPVNLAPFFTALGISTIDNLSDLIREKERSLSFFDQTKRKVLKEIQNPNSGDYITSLAIENIDSKSAEIEAVANDMNLKIDQLVELMNNAPTAQDDKPVFDNFIDSVKRVIRSFQDAQRGRESLDEDPNDTFQDLVDQGLVSQEDLDDFLAGSSFERVYQRAFKSRVIKELGDRYYTIDSAPTERQINVESVAQFNLVDSDGKKVEEVFGHETSSLLPDGTIRMLSSSDISTAQNAGKVLSIQPIGQKKRQGSKGGTRNALRLAKEDMENEFRFEVWACLLFDVAEWIWEKWQVINRAMNSIASSIRVIKSLIEGSPIGFIAGLQQVGFGSLADIKNALNSTLKLGTVATETIGVRSTLSRAGLPLPGGRSGAGVCGNNQGKYCSIRESLKKFFEEFEAELDAFEISLGGLDLNYGDKLRSYSDALDVYLNDMQAAINENNKYMRGLFKDVCTFIDRRLRGVPKSVSTIQAALAGIVILVTQAPSLGITLERSPTLERLRDRFINDGFLAAAEKLREGDIEGFLNLSEVTYAGQVARCLEIESDKEEFTDRSRRLSILADFARTRDDRQTSGQRINDGVFARFNLRSDSSLVEVASDEARKLLR